MKVAPLYEKSVLPPKHATLGFEMVEDSEASDGRANHDSSEVEAKENADRARSATNLTQSWRMFIRRDTALATISMRKRDCRNNRKKSC